MADTDECIYRVLQGLAQFLDRDLTPEQLGALGHIEQQIIELTSK